MKTIALLATLCGLTAGSSHAQVTQRWTAGWNNFFEPLDYQLSGITWLVTPQRQLKIIYKLVGATPNKVYQVGVHIFCTTFPATFGQFPTYSDVGGGTCEMDTAQGVTETLVAVEFAVILTDVAGNGSVNVSVGPIPSGTYSLEFDARNGAGCDLVNHGPCNVDFQSPGPTFGTATTVVAP